MRLPLVPRSASISRSRSTQPAVRLRIGKVAPHVAQSLGESLPGILGDRGARAGGDRLAHLFAELLIAPIAVRDPDDREALGEGLTDGQVIERRHQLARGEIAADAEDDHRRRGDDAVDLGGAQRIQRFLAPESRRRPDATRPRMGREASGRSIPERRPVRRRLVVVSVVVAGVSVIGRLRASQGSLHRRRFPLPGVPVPPPCR